MLINATTGMNVEIVNEIRYTQKEKYHMIQLM